MADDKDLYKKILKSTTLFGGVQLFNIFLAIIRAKTIALLIGPAGMGIAALLSTAINLISGVTSLGLETSGVKYISENNASEDKSALLKIIAVLKKVVWITGLAGAFLMVALSPWLSRLTFGNTDFTMWFIWLALALLFKQLSTGHFAILQGLQKLKFLASANFAGSFVGLMVSIPLYYYYRLEAIVPAIIISAAATLFFAWYYSQKVRVETVKIPARQLLKEGKAMLILGIMLSLSGLITIFVTYVIQLYIGSKSDLSEVGLYSAGITLLNSYVAIIFTAMSTDYFPRLASISEDNDQVRSTVLHQAQISILVITPIILLFLAFAPSIIAILYSTEFTAVVPMVSIGIVGMLFRAVSWSMGYILLAKGDSGMFIRTAFGFNSLYLLLSVGGYFFYGLTGLGIAFTIHYFIHFVVLRWLTRKRYDFYMNSDFNKSFFVCILFCGAAYFFTFIDDGFLKYSLTGLLCCSAVLFSVYKLHRKIDLIQIFNQIKGKLK